MGKLVLGQMQNNDKAQIEDCVLIKIIGQGTSVFVTVCNSDGCKTGICSR